MNYSATNFKGATFYILAAFISLNFISAHAAKLTGKVTDTHHEPVAFVNVYIKGTTTGTTTNIEGNYSLELSPGVYEVIYRIIGYKQHTETITITTEPVKHDVVLKEESYQLKEVTIKADEEDPAYAIIRKAQKKRKFYMEQVEEYSCNAYVKSTQRLVSYPKKIFGQDVQIEQFIDSATKIFYLSESVSKFYFRRPNDQKEEMISSRVSGNPRSYSFNSASDLLIDMYENLISLSGLTPRGIVSPISSNALFFYNYQLEGTFIENGNTVNKIKVIPKRANDPVFTGYIYILDDSWRIHSDNLFITKNQQMDFVDTFWVQQSYLAVNDSVWLPFNNDFSYVFSFLGFKGNGIVTGIFSDYNITPHFANRFFSGEVMKVNAEANKKDSVYWKQTRPMPLTMDETMDYHRRDSSRVIQESKPYKDSIDRKNNKFSPFNLFSGYNWQNSYRHRSILVSSLINNISYNTVEGWNMAMNVLFNQGFKEDDRREWNIGASARYGFSNTHFNGFVSGRYFYNTRTAGTLSAQCGSDVVQYNPANPISPMVNTLYSLMAEKNYMKIYEKQFFKIQHTSELMNGLVFGINAEYAKRIPLTNTTTYSFVNVDGRDYTSNNPMVPDSDALTFPKNNAFITGATLQIRFKQAYLSRPEGKINLGSDFPVLRFNYRKAIPFSDGDVDFDFLKITVEDELGLGLFGRLNYIFSYGDFLSVTKIYFNDLNHFNGNKTWFSSFGKDHYNYLDYYDFSTDQSFYEAHLEHNFGGFFLNKIPGIRKLKLNEIAGFHYLHTNLLDNYSEVSFGFEKLNFIRADFFMAFADGRKSTVGFVIGLKTFVGD